MNKQKYSNEQMEELALIAIVDNKLFFIEDIIPFMPYSRALFYSRNMDKLDSIKEALIKNKTEVKISLRSKWYKSTNATLQLALMKLIANEEERKALSTSYMEAKQEFTAPDFSNLSTDDIISLLNDNGQPE